MIQTFEIQTLHCLCCKNASSKQIAYILYPMDILNNWIEEAAEKYGTTIVVITGMDWQNALTPWAAAGVPKGSPDFKGEASEFLALLRNEVIPETEKRLDLESVTLERNLFGVSLSGLFTFWQWLQCDEFRSIASLSGSFWYEDFLDWVKRQSIAPKQGVAYFSLGDQEAKSRIKAFDTVAVNTQEILALLKKSGIETIFESVPGNHYSDPIPRLDKAFKAIYPDR